MIYDEETVWKGQFFWSRNNIDSDLFVTETEKAVLIRVPDSAFKDYSFWVPKKFVRKIKNVTEFKRIFYPSDFRVNLKKDDKVYNVSIHFAISCILNPHEHPINDIESDIENRRAYREYAGF